MDCYGLLIRCAENPTKSSQNIAGTCLALGIFWGEWEYWFLVPVSCFLQWLGRVVLGKASGRGTWPLKNHHLRLIVDEAPTSSSNGTWSAWTQARDAESRECQKSFMVAEMVDLPMLCRGRGWNVMLCGLLGCQRAHYQILVSGTTYSLLRRCWNTHIHLSLGSSSKEWLNMVITSHRHNYLFTSQVVLLSLASTPTIRFTGLEPK